MINQNIIKSSRKKRTVIILITVLFLTFFIFHDSYYFNFDKIEHYQIKEMNYFDRENDSIKIENKELLSEMLFDKIPIELNETEFLNDLHKVAIKHNEIPNFKFNEIKEIFREQSCSTTTATSCISVFRDVLVFYEKNKVVGIAKICFSCEDYYILGTSSNTSNFGQCGNYKKLNNILN